MPDTLPETAESGNELGVPRSRIVVASMIGTTIEFYDFYHYCPVNLDCTDITN